MSANGNISILDESIQILKDFGYIVQIDSNKLVIMKSNNTILINQNMISITADGDCESFNLFDDDFESCFKFYPYNDSRLFKFYFGTRYVVLGIDGDTEPSRIKAIQSILILMSEKINEGLIYKNKINLKKIRANTHASY